MATKYYVDGSGNYLGGWIEDDPNIPAGSYEIDTPPDHATCIWDFGTTAWKWPKTTLKDHLADKRWEKETGGILWNGVPIRTDDRSKMLLSGIQKDITDRADPTHTRKVKTIIGFITATDADLESIYNDVVAHIQKCFDAEDLTIPKIDDETLTTLSEVETELDAQYDAL